MDTTIYQVCVEMDGAVAVVMTSPDYEECLARRVAMADELYRGEETSYADVWVRIAE